jgi:hypothetical protein
VDKIRVSQLIYSARDILGFGGPISYKAELERKNVVVL